MVKVSTASPNRLSSSNDDDDDGYESDKYIFTLIEEAEKAFEKAKVDFHDIYGSNIIDEIVRCNKLRRPTKSWRRSKSSKALSGTKSQSTRTLLTSRTTPERSPSSRRSTSYRQIFDDDDDDDDQVDVQDFRSYFANNDYNYSPKSVTFFDRELNNSHNDYDDPIRLKPRYLFGEATHLSHLPLDSDENLSPPSTIVEVEPKKQPQILRLQMTANIPKKKKTFYNMIKKSKSPEKSKSYYFEISVCDNHNASIKASSSKQIQNTNKW